MALSYLMPFVHIRASIKSIEKGNHHFQTLDELTNEYFATAEKWHFIKKVEEQPHIYYEKNFDKEFNFWWYRGTIFHIFSIVGFRSSSRVSEATQNRCLFSAIFPESGTRSLAGNSCRNESTIMLACSGALFSFFCR